MPSSAPLAPNTIVAERFCVHRVLGEGATGRVYEVEHLQLGQRFAMKVLHAGMLNSPDIRKRFEREARTIAQLDHPGIVRVVDFGDSPEVGLFMVTELVAGAPLGFEALPAERAVQLILRVLDALGHAHGQGVVHRDLKPDNVLLAPEDTIKVLDFGLARLLGAEGEVLTQQGAVFGTPRYMSPEQASGEVVDHRTDLYAVGVMLYELLEGQPPFEGKSAVEVLRKHITQPPPRATKYPRFAAVLERALQKEPADRFQSSAEFVGALLSPSASTSAKPRSKSPKALRLGIGAALVFAGLMAAVGLSSSPEDAVQESLRNGQVDKAAALLSTLRTEKGETAQTHLLGAHIAFARDHDSVAVDGYVNALKLDPEVGGDEFLAANLPVLLKRARRTSTRLLKKLAKAPHAEAGPLLATMAQQAPTTNLRRTAYEGLERLDQTNRIETMSYLSAELKKVGSKRCPIRKWYVDRLIATKDPEMVPLLKRQLRKKDGLFGIIPQSQCMERVIRSALKTYDSN